MRRLLVLCVLLLLPGQVFAAWSEVGSGSQRATKELVGAATSTTLAYPGNISSGTLLVVAGSSWISGAGPSTVTITGCGATWTTYLGSVVGSGFKEWIALGSGGSAGACTITWTPNASAWTSFSIDEFAVAGGNTFSVDVDGGHAGGASSTNATDTLTTLTANVLMLGVLAENGLANTFTVGSGWTQIGEIESDTNCKHSAMFQVATAATGYTVDWTRNTLNAWGIYDLAVKEVAAGGGPDTTPFYKRRIR